MTADCDYYLIVTNPLKVIATSLPDANVGVFLREFIEYEGGRGPYTMRVAPGSNPLPPGLVISQVIYGVEGMPTQSGNFDFTIELSDFSSPPQTATGIIRLLVGNRLTLPSTQEMFGVIQRPFDATPTYYGGTPPFTWSTTSGIPSGLSLEPSTGRFTGIPSELGDYDVLLQVRDSADPPVTANGLTFLQIRPPLSITASRLDDGAKG